MRHVGRHAESKTGLRTVRHLESRAGQCLAGSKTDRNVIGRRRRLPSGVSEMVFGKCWPAIKHLSLPNTADSAALLSRTEGIMVQRLNFLHRYTIHTDVYIYS